LQFYHDRYIYDDTFALVRSIVYFDNAENTIEPISLDSMKWKENKKIIRKSLDDYYKKYKN